MVASPRNQIKPLISQTDRRLSRVCFDVLEWRRYHIGTRRNPICDGLRRRKEPRVPCSTKIAQHRLASGTRTSSESYLSRDAHVLNVDLSALLIKDQAETTAFLALAFRA
jgi:hypothetical protein